MSYRKAIIDGGRIVTRAHIKVPKGNVRRGVTRLNVKPIFSKHITFGSNGATSEKSTDESFVVDIRGVRRAIIVGAITSKKQRASRKARISKGGQIQNRTLAVHIKASNKRSYSKLLLDAQQRKSDDQQNMHHFSELIG